MTFVLWRAQFEVIEFKNGVVVLFDNSAARAVAPLAILSFVISVRYWLLMKKVKCEPSTITVRRFASHGLMRSVFFQFIKVSHSSKNSSRAYSSCSFIPK